MTRYTNGFDELVTSSVALVATGRSDLDCRGKTLALDWSSRGDIAAGGAGGWLMNWNSSGELRWTHQTDRFSVNAVASSMGGEYVASGGQDGDAIVWDAANGQRKHTFHTNGAVHALAFAEDTLIVGQRGVGFYSIETGAEEDYWELGGRKVQRLAMWKHNRVLAITHWGSSIDFYDVGSGKHEQSLAVQEPPNWMGDSWMAFGEERSVTTGDGDQIALWHGVDVPVARLLVLPSVSETAGSSEWLVYTHDGFYVGPDRAEEHIRWRTGMELLPADALREKKRRSEIVQRRPSVTADP